MTPAVSLQCTALKKCLPTVLTNMWSVTTVDLLVAPERAGSGETFIADATVVWFDSGVASHVHLHVLEGLPTDPASSTGLSVDLQVSQQNFRRV